MRTETALSVFISILGVLTVSAALSGASPEEAYLETRDRFIRQIAKGAGPLDDRPALAELEEKARTIVAPVEIEGFPTQGRINLLTLRDETGFGQVDGLRFDSERESLFVTTETLLERYLAAHHELPKTLSELSRSEEFYRRVFLSDAGVAYYAEVPVMSANGQSFVHAFLGKTGQEIGPFVPDEIFVFVSTGKRIMVVYAPAATEITDIPQCKGEWERFDQMSSESLELYRSSQLKELKAFDDSLRYREQGFNRYRRCFGREAGKQQFFASLKEQAQSIADRLQRNWIEKDDAPEGN